MVALHPSDLSPGPGACFRFRHAGGAPWWERPDQHREVVGMLHQVLSDPTVTKVTHFGIQHDLPFLLDLGFKVEGKLLDTSVLLHAVHSELPKGLQKNATLFCGAPAWKDIKDEKEGREAVPED